MTKVTIGNNYIPRAAENGGGDSAKSGGAASSFARALKTGHKGDCGPKSGDQKSGFQSADQNGGGNTVGSKPGLPTYQSTKVMSLGDVTTSFRSQAGPMDKLTSHCDLKQIPSIAVMDLGSKSGGGEMRHIGNTIFVDQQHYNDWKSGSDGNQFESNLYQMVSRVLASIQ